VCREEIVVTRIMFAAVAVVVAGTQSMKPAPGTGATLPERFESYLTTIVQPLPAERQRLLEGAPITKLLDADASKEVAVFGAIWINAPIPRYVQAVQDIETFERGGGFPVTKRISTPPRLEDFADLHLPESDVADLRTCRVGNCEVKLGERALQRIQTEVDWKAGNPQTAVDALMRRLALDYVTGYVEGGNEQLAVYRDSSRPTFVAQEFRAMVERMPELTSYMPDIRRYLLDYPRQTIPDSTSFLYWQETKFGLKPTFRISHLTIREAPDDTVVASKMLYASHYFWTGIELRALLPDPSRGSGFWFVTVNRSRSDGLSGFTGAFVRRHVRSGVQEGALAALTATKRMLEQTR
jgi:hypothetical protein